MVHIGKEIEKRVQELNLSITELGEKINTVRSNIYDIYDRKTIDTGLLLKISEVLQFDFFKFYISPDYKLDEINKMKKQTEELLQENVYLKKINALLEEQVKNLKSQKTD